MNTESTQFDTELDDASEQESMTIRSGTGAPIFEAGPTTRIRRNPVRAIARVDVDGDRRIFGQIVDVSLTGCLLKTATTIPTDANLELTITLVGGDDHDDFEVGATVRRTTDVDDRRGYGLEFCTDSIDQRRTVQALYSATAC